MEKLDLPKCNRKCYRGYEQTFIHLLKIHFEVVGKQPFLCKISNFGHMKEDAKQAQVESVE